MKLLLLTIAFLSLSAMGGEERYFSRSIHGALMGDAYTALADDEHALYYNPALLGRHSGFSFWPINPTITATNPLEFDFSNLETTGDDPAQIASTFMDKPIHIGLGAAPGFKLGRFGITAIVNNQTSFNVVNQVTPMLDIDHRYDRGFIAGYGFPLRRFSNASLSFGFSTKYVQRESVYGVYNIASPTLLDAFSAGDMEGILNALGKTTGDGWGFDFGLDYVKKSGPSTFSAGLALLDVYTNINTDSNEYDREVQDQPMQVNFGTAWKALIGPEVGLTLSADIRNLEQQMDFMRRVRLGAEVSLTPALSVLGGVNANQYSYGFKVNTGLLSIYAGFYNVDIGEEMGDLVSKRFALYLSLFDFTFDA